MANRGYDRSRAMSCLPTVRLSAVSTILGEPSKLRLLKCLLNRFVLTARGQELMHKFACRRSMNSSLQLGMRNAFGSTI